MSFPYTIFELRAFFLFGPFFGPSKSLDFVPGLFRILDLSPFSDLVGKISQHLATFTAPLHL